MDIVTHNQFADHYVPTPCANLDSKHLVLPADEIQVLMCKDLETEVASYKSHGFFPIGSAEFVGRGNHGVGREARLQASAVGAALVLFTLIPAKLRSIHRKHDGTIDLAAVLADPPATLSPRGYSVLRSVFLAKAAERGA